MWQSKQRIREYLNLFRTQKSRFWNRTCEKDVYLAYHPCYE
jgi:hypothetical protein